MGAAEAHHNDMVVLMLPPFDPDTGRLPEGLHDADWDEVVERFGWNPRRRQLLDGLADAIDVLAAAGCRRLAERQLRHRQGGAGRLRRLLGQRGSRH